MVLELMRVFAQTDSSTMGDFFGQISGLLILTCGAGIVWMGLMALVFQRATERRRRAAQGLEPLPAIHVAAYRWLTGQRGAQPAAPALAALGPARESPSKRPSQPAPVPAPDLSLLTGDLPQPDLADMVMDAAPEPAPRVDRAPTMPEPAPDDDLFEAEPVVSVEQEPEPSLSSDAVELLQVWRDLSDGSLIVEIGGRRFQSLDELRSADLERRFLNVVRDLDVLAERQPGRAAPAGPVESSAPSAPDEPLAPSLTPGGMLRQMTRAAMGQAPETVEEKPGMSIADEIEDLLQDRLTGDPAFSQRSIHVKPALDGGVQIEVDGQYFAGVGDVDDADVRALLTAVVREWEGRQ